MSLKQERGITLTELLVASVLALIVIIGIGSIDVTRVRMAQAIQLNSGQLNQEQAALAAIQIADNLRQADRLDFFPDVGMIQVRTPRTPPITTNCNCTIGADGRPTPTCYDCPANYRWDQYVFRSGELDRFNDIVRMQFNPATGLWTRMRYCDDKTVLATGLVNASGYLVHKDEGPKPPGSEPTFIDCTDPTDPNYGAIGSCDNNVAFYTLTWRDPKTNKDQVFQGEVTIRASGYTNVSTGGLPSPGGADINPPLPVGLTGQNCKVICTELYRQGYVPEAWYSADIAYARAYIDDTTRAAYFAWSKPLVSLMQHSTLVTQLVRPIGIAWAKHMAYIMGVSQEDSLFGRLLNDIGVPLHHAVGAFFVKYGLVHPAVLGREASS